MTSSESATSPIILLIDNGSVRADATLGLRLLAKNLSEQVKRDIFPVSLAHADSISIDELDGKLAYIFRDFMADKLSKGERNFIVLPLFFGESRAITVFLPDVVEQLKQQYGDFELTLTDVLFSQTDDEELSLANILYDHVIEPAKRNNLLLKNIVLVDHGSPSTKVTAVRNALADLIQDKLTGVVDVAIDEAAMERRAGKEYDFNGQLLESYLLEKAKAGETQAIVVLQFFLSGRHAGKGGDIVTICNSVMQKYPDFKIVISPLISEHPQLISLLAKRLDEVFS